MSCSPPWEALILVATYLDPKTLAIASCVSKLWFLSMSSDHIWKSILTTHFPSLSLLPSSAGVSSRSLFTLARAAATRRRRPPKKPALALGDLIFTVNISTRERTVASVARGCDALRVHAQGRFRFGVACDGAGLGEEGLRVTWSVALKGWRGVFVMMEKEGRAGEGWFLEELPPPECCSGAAASSVAADLTVAVGEVSVGILSIVDWRYVSVDDGLRYLQHFLFDNTSIV
ncbi:hypothetical protein VNO78_21411 [Psophocarpus tetragonolobus]|uniref:F-box protein n=1 Tax=Psophocarpus tetragonolobus TaxID=3891 RepID=A0AAN9XI69_PSOTE